MNRRENQIFQKKKSGDLILVAQMLGITNKHAYVLLHRKTAKRHQEAVDALGKVVKSRENILSKK